MLQDETESTDGEGKKRVALTTVRAISVGTGDRLQSLQGEEGRQCTQETQTTLLDIQL